MAKAPKAPVPKPEPQDQAALVRHEQQLRDLSGRQQNIVIGPGGIRKDGAPYLGVRVKIGNKTDLLANPANIVRKDKLRHGHVYAWAKRDNNLTTAWINCGWYEPVEFEDLDRVPGATVQMVELPAGPRPEDGMRRFVVDGGLMLVSMPQEVWESIYKRAEEQAWGDQAAMNLSLQQRISDRLGSQGVVAVETRDLQTETMQVAAPQQVA